MAGNAERTYLMIKPDGVQRGLVGKIVMRFEERGYKLVSSPPAPSRAAGAARCRCRRCSAPAAFAPHSACRRRRPAPRPPSDSPAHRALPRARRSR